MKPMTKLIRSTVLTSTIVCLASPLAQADNQGRRYSIEMIVFSYEKKDTEQSEQWPKDIQVELPDQYLRLYPSSAANQKSRYADQMTLEQLSDLQQGLWPDRILYRASQLNLSAQKRRLTQRDEFKVLYHQAWHMPLNDKTKSLPIRIQGGERFDGLYELEGSVQFSVARYLHIDTQLYLSEFERAQPRDQDAAPTNQNTTAISTSDSDIVPSSPPPALSTTQYKVKQVVPLKQTRKMRSGELHYIDNPRYGILVQITPYKPNEKLTDNPS